LSSTDWDSDDTLSERNLTESVRSIWVKPPSLFTGCWVTYFTNGQPADEIHYAGGRYAGTFTSFHSNGSKAVVQHYGPQGAEGEETDFFPSGHVSARGTYSAEHQIGTWTWYNEDGSIRVVKNFADS
jgi:antitoxin component YwqK of YwqJK toxin-antitoxin module